MFPVGGQLFTWWLKGPGSSLSPLDWPHPVDNAGKKDWIRHTCFLTTSPRKWHLLPPGLHCQQPPGVSRSCPGGGGSATVAGSPHHWREAQISGGHLVVSTTLTLSNSISREAYFGSNIGLQLSLNTIIQGYLTIEPNLKRDTGNSGNASINFSCYHTAVAFTWKSGHNSTLTNQVKSWATVLLLEKVCKIGFMAINSKNIIKA